MAEKSALRLIPGKDALLQYTPAVYNANSYVEYNGLIYRALVNTSATFITSEWTVISDLRDIRVNFIRDRNALTGSTPTTGTTGYNIPIIDNTNVLVLNATADPAIAANKFARYNYNKTTAKWLLLQISTGSTSSNVSNYTLLTNRPNIISGVTVTAGAGLTGGGSISGAVPPSVGTISLQHADTSSQASLNPTGYTYTQKLKVDTYGHVTGATTSLWVHPDTSSQANITNTGLTYIQSIQLDGAGHLIGMSSGTWVHPDNSTQGSVINTGNTTYIQSVQLDSVGHVTGLVSATIPTVVPGINFNAAGNSGGSIAMPNGGTLQITGGTNINTVSSLHGTNVGLRINMTPAGSNGQLQFNNSGTLAGTVGLSYLSSILTTPSLTISTAPLTGTTGTTVLMRDTTTGVVKQVQQSFLKTTIAGSNTQVQINSSGVLGASSNLTFTGNTTLVSSVIAITTTPSAGSTDDLLTWNSGSKKITKVTQASIVTGKLDTTSFNAYTASTTTTINGKLSTAAFNVYSGNTSNVIVSLSNNKLNVSTFNTYTGLTSTLINTKLNTTSFVTYTGTTVPATYLTKSTFNAYSGATATNIGNRLLTSSFNFYSGTTGALINTKLATSSFNFYTGTTVPTVYLTKSAFNTYSGITATNIGNRLLTSSFNFYSGTTFTLIGTKLVTSSFNTYSGVTATRLGIIENNYVTGATSLGNNTILGTKSGKNLRFKGLAAGTNITLTPTSTGITISSTGGGGATVAGTSTQIQYNLSGSLGASSNFVYNPSNFSFSHGGRFGTTGSSSVVLGGGSTFGSNSASNTNSIAIGANNTVDALLGIAIGQNNLVQGSTNNNSMAIGDNNIINGSNGNCFAFGSTNTVNGFSAVAIGSSLQSTGSYSFVCNRNNTSSGTASFSSGVLTTSSGSGSFTGGQGFSGIPILASGNAAFNISQNTVAQTGTHGAIGNNSAILGGVDHNIASGNDRAVILGGNAIKLNSGYSDFVAVANLAIFTTPSAGGSDDVLTWNSTSKKVGKVTQASISDERLKKDLQPLTSVVQKIDTLSTVEFKYNENNIEQLVDKPDYGLIAQEVEKLFPHVVKDNYEIGDTTYKTVNYQHLVPILFAAIKELSEKIKVLEGQK